MKLKLSSLYLALICAVLLASMHFLANTFYFYWTLWWYDVIMHFLAGVTGGLATYWMLFQSNLFFKSEVSKKMAIGIVLVIMMCVGVAWEVFEYTNGITDSQEGYALDTFNDLVLDGCGAVFAVLIIWKKRHSSVNSL